MPSEIVIVPHTHWDREWYEPHDVFRLRLVHMLDTLLDTLEANPEYAFTLDGQAAAVDDYLAMRPESRARVEALVASGQLAIGPFLILLDEFCCDGETIVRNLELGIRASRALGDELRVGYLPDMFGHAAQMPQILRGFGIRDAALWRGVPDRIRSHAFAWRSPDGSAVRCEYLFDGYGNGLDMFAVPGQLDRLAGEYAGRVADWYGDAPVLGMLGTDHSSPPADLVQTVSGYNDRAGDPELSIETIGRYVARFDRDDEALSRLPEVVGELRSHARGNLLPGVFSIRTNLKAAMAETEALLTVAERLDAIHGTKDHRAFFDTAWYRLVESTAHDSVTGCGVDATAEQVGTRIRTAGHIARGVIGRTLGELASRVTPDEHVVVNPSGFARRAHVEVTLHDADPATLGSGVQLLDELPVVLGDERMTTAELPKLLRRIHGRELFGQQINAYAWSDGALRFDVAESPVGVFDLAAFTEELEQAIASDPSGGRSWHVETIAAPRRRALLSAAVAGTGAVVVTPATASTDAAPVVVGGSAMRNGLLTVTVGDDGAVRVESVDGVVLEDALRLVDEGDRGDSYNYGPVDAATAVSTPVRVDVDVLETGPLRGRVRVRRTYEVPAGIDADDRSRRTAQTRELVVDTDLELREAEDFLRVRFDVVNTVADHRLRVLVPTGEHGLASSRAAGQYGVTERGREGEGGWGEFPLPTYPATRFASAGAANVLVRKLTEFEVIGTDDGDALALTLVRAVGMMSVNVHPLRDEPAGSEIPVPGAQYLGERVTTSFALLPRRGDEASVVRAADLVRLDPLVVRGTGSASTPIEGRGAEVHGDVPLESLRRVGGDHVTELRFVNYLDVERSLTVDAEGEWDRVDLAGDVVAAGVDLGTEAIPANTIATYRRRV